MEKRKLRWLAGTGAGSVLLIAAANVHALAATSSPRVRVSVAGMSNTQILAVEQQMISQFNAEHGASQQETPASRSEAAQAHVAWVTRSLATPAFQQALTRKWVGAHPQQSTTAGQSHRMSLGLQQEMYRATHNKTHPNH
jgi:hypothetical protein